MQAWCSKVAVPGLDTHIPSNASPRLHVGLAAALLVVLTAIAIGPAALLAVLFFLLSAWSLGDLLLRKNPSIRAPNVSDGVRVAPPLLANETEQADEGVGRG